MAIGEVDICNIALSNIGTKSTVTAITPPENSAEARQCSIHYANARDYVLGRHPWKFAEKRVALSILGTAPSDWAYSYAYPSDCIRAIAIVMTDRNSETPEPFATAVSDDLKSKLILTDKEGAYLKYTARVTIPVLFDAGFIETVAWYLGFKMALPLTGSKTVREQAYRGYLAALDDARAGNLGEAEGDPQRDAEWLIGRD